MIPILGIISLVILIISLGAMFFHSRLLLYRGILDDGLSRLDEILRIRLEIIYDATESSEDDIRTQCLELSGKTAREIIKALPKLQKYEFEEYKEALTENAQEIEQAVGAVNDAIKGYNAYISKSYGMIIALLVGLKAEKEIPV